MNKVLVQRGDRKRWCNPLICKNCGETFYRSDAEIKARPCECCSRKCSDAYKKSKSHIQLICDSCGNTFNRLKSKSVTKSGLVFCSKDCKEAEQRIGGKLELEHYEDGIASYREKAFRKIGCMCQKCGYSDDDRMLDVHHKDGNRRNNRISNLEVLCVWCHALETRKDWKQFNK